MDTGLAAAVTTTTLESCLTEHDRPVLLSGIQALVRVLLEQSITDRAAGLNTAGLVSGYRGSPLGGLDQELWRRSKLLAAHDIRFQPGLNEDLAATMLWGAQQLDAFPGKRVEGVFGMWYGKGPGVDRSGDALRAANVMGTNALGGVLAVAGDDHGAHSSTYPHQTEQIFEGAMIPVLVPGSVADIVSLGLAGIALSRASGLWAALKTTAEIAEQAATVIVPSEHHFAPPTLPPLDHPRGFDPSLRHPRDRAVLEQRLYEERLPAALAFARANRLDRLMHGNDDAEIGIVTVGKAHMDTMRALDMLGLRRSPKIAVYKIALAWPIEAERIRDFARGKRLLIVVEEKRSFVEQQIRAALYNLPADVRPPIAGKTALDGSPLLTPLLELTPEITAGALSRTFDTVGLAVPSAAPVEEPSAARPEGLIARTPAFCAGCPHGTSTRVPEGSFATAGIGCHFMALDDADGRTRTFTHMGGEGVTWIGLAPFTEVPHMFVNLGDGTYQHSGILAIRQAVTAGARVTYKILYNDAVAMTGGQPVEGSLTATQIAHQIAAEGVKHIALVADDPERLPPVSALPPGVLRHGRDDLETVQRAMRENDGVSVIIYDQMCANEKRRRRKRGKLPESPISVVINEAVCEGCGDCGEQSHCIAIEPSETTLGRKRRINPTACNVDLSCLKGFCPSFVTVDGAPRAPEADPRWKAEEAERFGRLPAPPVTPLTSAWSGLFAGIGGGGVVTTGAIAAMAAHLDGRAVSTLDFTGLAQKNGAVVSHVQIAPDPSLLDVVRIPLAGAAMMLAPDLAVASGPDVLGRCAPDAAVVGNLDLVAGAAFRTEPRLAIDAGLHRRTIERATDKHRSTYLHAARIAERLFGNAQAMNTMLLGLAWQDGLVPVSEAALLRAIELNGASVEVNRRAFLWGRALAHDPTLAAAVLADEPAHAPPATLDALVADRAALLREYQGRRTANRYRARVAAIVARETAAMGKPGAVSRAAAEGWFRVMYLKDEAEVARLHLAAAHDPSHHPTYHLAPPLITRIDPATGRRRKIAIPGRIARPIFHVLQHMKHLRGTPFDPFAWQKERRIERGWADTYATDLDRALRQLSPATLDIVRQVADLPDIVRGYGPVRLGNWRRMQEVRAALLARLDAPAPLAVAAE